MSPRLAQVLVGAHVFAAVLLVVVIAGWLRLERRRAWVIGLGLLAAAGFTVLVLTRLPASAIPVRFITALQEGTTSTNIRQLHGRGGHAGPGLLAIGTAFSRAPIVSIRELVRLNLWLAGLNVIFFFVLSALTLRRLISALLLTVAFTLNLVFIHAALSEVPAQLVTLCLFSAVTAAAVLDRHKEAPAWLRSAALVLLVSVTLCVGLVRAEAALAGIAALAVAVVRLRMGDERASAWARRALAPLEKLAAARWISLAAVSAALLLWWAAAGFLPNGTRWLAQATHPLNPSILTLPAVMLYFVPLGVAALSLLGLVHTLRRPLRFFLAPLSLVVLYRLYYAAQSGFYELFRYLTFIMPFAFFFALFGFRELEALAERRAWQPRWRIAAVVAVALACAVFPLPGTIQLWIGGPPRLAFDAVLLERNQQREVRYLLELVQRHPTCVFVTKTAARPVDPGRPLGADEYELQIFGRSLGSDVGQSWSESAMSAAIPASASCAFFYRGLDCNLTHGDRCEEELRGLPVVEERSFGNLPYNTVSERGEPGPIVTLGIYRIR